MNVANKIRTIWSAMFLLIISIFSIWYSLSIDIKEQKRNWFTGNSGNSTNILCSDEYIKNNHPLECNDFFESTNAMNILTKIDTLSEKIDKLSGALGYAYINGSMIEPHYEKVKSSIVFTDFMQNN